MSGIDLARVVDLAARLEADAALDPDQLRYRDRTLGRELSLRADDATTRISAWLDAQRDADPMPGRGARRAQRALRGVLVAVGLAVGVTTTLAVFAYDGTHPVNGVQVLAVFVGLQLVTLVATALVALPEHWRRRVPGLALVQDVLRLASPGRWLPGLRRLLGAEQREAFDRAAGLARRHQRMFGDAEKWSLLVASQGFAVAFHLAALATAVGLVTFSDLAFGWSTTLDVDAARLHRISTLLSTPWAGALPDAVPTRELIETTRYFRGDTGAAADPRASAAWWRFLLLCMALYGLVPRVSMLGFAAWRQRVAWRRVFARLPGVAELLDRLESHQVETAGAGDERGGAAASGTSVVRRRLRVERVQAVCWSGVAIEDEALASLARDLLGAEVASRCDGGAGAPTTDAALVASLAANDAAPLLLVKAWEPPLLEDLDFLEELRRACGEERPLIVLPLARSEAGLLPASGPDADTWLRRLDTLGDPGLAVVTAEAGS